MERLAFCLNAQVGISTAFFNKRRNIFAFLFIAFFTTFSGQEIAANSDYITVVGDAYIYSKDKAFNEVLKEDQVLENHSKKIFICDNDELIVVSQLNGEISDKQNSKKNEICDNVYKLTSKKKHEKQKNVSSGRDIDEKLTNTNIVNFHFSFEGEFNKGKSFTEPNNNFPSLRSIILFEWFGGVSLEFLYKEKYFSKNIKSGLLSRLSRLSVRPPPVLM